LQVPRKNDPVLIQSTSQLAEKYPDNTTIVHMDKNGNYKVVHGLKLDEICYNFSTT
jgi:hypothetical protein